MTYRAPRLTAGSNITLTDTGAAIEIAASGGGAGITALTGDVTASGTGSVAATIAATLDTIPAPVASVDFNAQQATSFLIENRTDDTGCTQVGRIWLRTDL